MSKQRTDDFSEDMFAETRMTFGEHLEELRVHLIRALYGFGIALVVSMLFLARPMLHIISAPVTKQLEAFYKRLAKTQIEELPNRPELQEANRPRWVKFSGIRKLVESPLRANLPQPWPDNGQPSAFVDLVERAHVDLAHAEDSLESNEWERLPKLADDIAAIAERLSSSAEVPESYAKKFVDNLAKMLSEGAGELRAGAAERNRIRTRAALHLMSHSVPLDDLAGDRLVSRWVRIDEPLLLAWALNDPLNLLTGRFDLSALSIQEGIMAWFKVGMVCGLVIGCPWIFYQIWLFIAAGLYPHEKRLVNVYLPVSVGLFLIGVVICQLFVMPKAIEALLWFNAWLDMKPDLRFNEWLSFAIMMPVVFGVSFQLPMLMTFLERIGVFTIETYRRQWKIAFFLIHIFAAIITPSVDVISMELLALPMFGLYWLGILLCKMRPRHPDFDIEVPDSEEPVGV